MDFTAASRCIKHVVLGEKYKIFIENGLNSLGIVPIWLPDNHDVDPRLSGHADLSLLHLGEKRFLAAPYLRSCTDFVEIMAEIGANLAYVEQQGRGYPQEVGLNVCICGDNVICNPKTADPTVISLLDNLKMIPVKQGYSRCAVCVVNDHAVITADHGVAETLCKHNFDVLVISAGHIRLDGFDYGFIGGASFVLGDGLLAFTGHLNAHPDAEAIQTFLTKHSVTPVYLSDRPIFDIGGAVLVNNAIC